jgi:hypothetical protein
MEDPIELELQKYEKTYGWIIDRSSRVSLNYFSFVARARTTHLPENENDTFVLIVNGTSFITFSDEEYQHLISNPMRI